MKTTPQKSKAGTPSRTEHLSTETEPVSGTKREVRLPRISLERRRANRALGTDAMLELLRTKAPRFFELAEVVGKWIWIQFAEAPAEQVRAGLSELGFHWNNKRQAWQHPCGQSTAGSPKEPREKYASYFPADSQRAA